MLTLHKQYLRGLCHNRHDTRNARVRYDAVMRKGGAPASETVRVTQREQN